MRILAVNPGAEAITGYSSQEIRGMRLTEVLGAELGQETSPLQRAILTGERVPPTETSIGGKDSVHDILLGIAPLGDGYLLSFTDITRLKEVDRLKTSIVANVSHELRTPLSSIKAYTELLLDDVGGGEPTARREFLSVIDQQADRLSHLISDLLDLSRLESGQFEVRKEPLYVDEVIADVVGHVEMERIEKTVSVRRDLSPVRRIVADRALLRIIVENLVTNAVKFSRPGGRVDVLAREEEDNLVLQVLDRGLGISSDEMPYLFQKFRRLEAAKQAGIKGTGLGLALVKEAVHAHDGSIEVHSEVGEGSCFTVRLPLKPSAHGPESPQRTDIAARGAALEGELR
jgi:PAS domain S-box-containing protein